MILKIPGLSDRNKPMNDYNTVHEPVELVDLFPTLVDATGLKSIGQCGNKSKTTKLCTEGKSLLPLIMNTLNNRRKQVNLIPYINIFYHTLTLLVIIFIVFNFFLTEEKARGTVGI